MRFSDRIVAVFVVLAASTSFALSSSRAADAPEPLWAYGYLTPPPSDYKPRPPGPPPPRPSPEKQTPEETRLRRIAGSPRAYSLLDLANPTDAADWFPDDHPPMPDVVRKGSPKAGALQRACAYCHLPNGKGRPENAPVSGLPPAYFIRQLQDFRDGLRTSADPRKNNTRTMIALARAMTDEEMKEAADYYAAQSATPRIRVVETALVPKTKLTETHVFSLTGETRTEPIGNRIIEVPEDVEQVEELENPRIGYVAYVPPGSVQRGQILATTGGATVVEGQPVAGRTVACITCHGPDLKGVAEIPGIAGRSPSYLARQLYDMQQGTRKAPLALLMQPVVANLTETDLVDLAAYVSSLGASK